MAPLFVLRKSWGKKRSPIKYKKTWMRNIKPMTIWINLQKAELIKKPNNKFELAEKARLKIDFKRAFLFKV
ncbi:hypothetical protein SAMN05660413_01023 [Salegentibacter flavus]|uniref:Uncharacterized protein n=1 Tax=Salegentibacter flavus TaxID=287099 RepID=A0A1I4YXT8_9FLAO|nr:hypothetical protein SAMN05660413_01023 [Salegentibacter flavus]